MSKWLLLLCTGCLVIIAVNSSPILNESETKTAEEAARQQTNEISNAPAAPAPVVPAPAVPSASPPAQSEDDDDDDDDDDEDDVGLIDDDDDDDDDDEGGTASDDDDEEDDDYDFERILDDILGEDDDEEEEEEETSSESASASPQSAATVASVAAPTPIQGLAASPSEEVEQANEQTVVVEDEDQVADENNPHTVTLLTNSQPDEADEAQEQILNTNDIGSPVANEASSTAAPEAADEEEDDEEEEDDDDDVLSDEEDDDDDEEEEEEARRARALGEAGAIAVPASYISKYNKYIDNIFSKINKVLKKNYDPVNVRLQTAPTTKKKPASSSKTSTKIKRKPASRPSSRTSTNNDKYNPTNATVTSVAHPPSRRSARSNGQQSRLLRKRRPQQTKAAGLIPRWFRCIWSIMDSELGYLGCNLRTNENDEQESSSESIIEPVISNTKSSSKQKAVRAKATLYGLSSLRRDGDVSVNVLNTHTTVRSKFFVGPLTLKVEKEFGRGAKKELRSAIATTSEMFGKLNLKVVHGGDTSLSSIKVMQPKQMRVEADDENDRTREFLWKRSSNFAHVVSQKLANAARSSLPPQTNNTSPLASIEK